ncbi:MAG: hypothetical protein ACFB00_03505 [Parvularculaceae bacterium]
MFKSNASRLALAISLDLIDFAFGRLPGVGTALDFIFAAIAFAVWGPAGLFALWEIVDPTNQLDAFVPTMTLIALSQMRAAKNKDGRASEKARGRR